VQVPVTCAALAPAGARTSSFELDANIADYSPPAHCTRTRTRTRTRTHTAHPQPGGPRRLSHSKPRLLSVPSLHRWKCAHEARAPDKGNHSPAASARDCAPLSRLPARRATAAIMDEEMREAPRQQAIQPPMFKAPKMVSRPKPPVQQEEELGAEPKLGDFEGEHALSISEARAVVTAIHTKRRQTEPGSNPLGGDRVHNDSQSIQQFVDYLDMFARYKQTENLHSMGGIFDSNPQINPIERAMLGR